MERKVTFLDRNEYNYAPAPEVGEVLKNFDPGKLCFYTRIYDEGKRSILSDFISNLYGIPEKQIVLGYGGEDILKQAVHYFLSGSSEPKKLLIPEFSWWYYKSIADEVNGNTVFYPLYEDGDTFRYDISEIKKIVSIEKPEVLLIASPNNPTGNSISPGELQDILSYVGKDTVVIIDEAYASFSNKDNSYIRPLLDQYPNLLIIRTLSNFYGLPGLRIGFAFMGKGLASFLNYSTKYLGFNRISEAIGIAVLKANDYYRKIADLMAEDRTLYAKELGNIDGFKVYRSQANFVLVKYPIQMKEALQSALESKGFIIKFMNEPGIDTHIRITLGTRAQNRIVIDTIKETAGIFAAPAPNKK